MKRLLYAPKAYVFVRSSTLGGRIFNLTTDVVSGSVTRNVNDVSKAEIILRNRYFKYLRFNPDKDDPQYDDRGKSIFLPMDMVTIWLQRIAGKPIQVFTGYLDSVPYYQLYPGNCKITATCTLKRLAYQWFDPGLEFFRSFVQAVDSKWFLEPTTGEATNYKSLLDVTSTKDPFGAQKKRINDGGFAKLIYDFMTEIAGWSPQDVMVSRLPDGLAKAGAKLYADIEDNTQRSQRQLEQQLAILMGINPSVGTTSTATDPNMIVAAAIQKAAGGYTVPSIVPLVAALVQTTMDENYSHGPDEGKDFGYGLYKLRPKKNKNPIPTGTSATPSLDALTGGAPAGYEQVIDGIPITQIVGDITTATNVFAKRLVRAGQTGPGIEAWYVNGSRSKLPDQQRKAVKAWIEAALQITLDEKEFQAKYQDAVTLAKNAGTVGAPSSSASLASTTSGGIVTWKNIDSLTKLDPADMKVFKQYSASTDATASVLFAAKSFSKDLYLTLDAQAQTHKSPDAIYIGSANPDVLKKFFNSFKGQKDVHTVQYAPSGATAQSLWDGKAASPQQTNITTAAAKGWPPGNMIRIVTLKAVTAAPAPASTPTTPGTPAPASTPPLNSLNDLARFSANSAFAAKFAFPVDFLESHNLVGDKALMNDVSCLDAVKQFSQASMRNFMSLPDGRALFFYPDYFGAHGRKPYWWIHDIEIINMGIQLNDEALATHVYVVGDGMNPTADGTLTWWDEVTTRGVATIKQVAMLQGFIDTEDKGPLGNFEDALRFLQHYGARPHKEEEPLIRNAFFEFLMAWQKFMQLWAAQFQTDVEFTFQPEVMAGGIVGFPEHNLQMYVEGVTHRWDYTSGFFTDAILSSPALLKKDGKHPGFALAGNINTVASGNLG